MFHNAAKTEEKNMGALIDNSSFKSRVNDVTKSAFSPFEKSFQIKSLLHLRFKERNLCIRNAQIRLP